MKTDIDDLHDYKLVAWSLDQSNWMMIFDIENPTRSIRFDFRNVVRWYANSMRSPIGILEMAFWQLEEGLSTDSRVIRSLTRLFGLDGSDDEVLFFSKERIEGYEQKLLVSFQTVDGGTLDLICDELVQK